MTMSFRKDFTAFKTNVVAKFDWHKVYVDAARESVKALDPENQKLLKRYLADGETLEDIVPDVDMHSTLDRATVNLRIHGLLETMRDETFNKVFEVWNKEYEKYNGKPEPVYDAWRNFDNFFVDGELDTDNIPDERARKAVERGLTEFEEIRTYLFGDDLQIGLKQYNMAKKSLETEAMTTMRVSFLDTDFESVLFHNDVVRFESVVRDNADEIFGDGLDKDKDKGLPKDLAAAFADLDNNDNDFEDGEQLGG